MVISYEEKKRQIQKARNEEKAKQFTKNSTPTKNQKLTKKQKQKARRKAKRRIIIGGIIAALGITGIAIVKNKLLPEGKESHQPNITTEKENNFKAKYKVKEEYLRKNESEAEKEVKQLENDQEVLAYLKNMYIEKYEEKTGDDTLKTNDIKIIQGSQNYMYIDTQTGDYISHGEFPNDTEKALKENNVLYEIAYNIETFKVQNRDGKTIDMETVAHEKVIPGNQYNEMKNYESVLEELGTVIPNGVEYMYDMENEEKKEEFIKSIQELKDREKQEKKINDNDIEIE